MEKHKHFITTKHLKMQMVVIKNLHQLHQQMVMLLEAQLLFHLMEMIMVMDLTILID